MALLDPPEPVDEVGHADSDDARTEGLHRQTTQAPRQVPSRQRHVRAGIDVRRGCTSRIPFSWNRGGLGRHLAAILTHRGRRRSRRGAFGQGQHPPRLQPVVLTQRPADLERVRDALGRQKFFQESAARTAVPGVATALDGASSTSMATVGSSAWRNS